MLIDVMHLRRSIGLTAMLLVVAACSVNTNPTSTTPPCWRSPLTDMCGNANNPIVVAKIDDVAEARPQFNLNAADLVIVEQVEGGLTRLFAVYQSKSPALIGPIRSARITDTDLAPAFGKPGFAYSGSAARLKPYLLTAQLQLIGAPQGGDGYFRIEDRAAPHNYLAELPTLRTRIPEPAAAAVTNVRAWPIAESSPAQGTPVTEVAVRWPASKKTYAWDGKRWQMTAGGAPLMTQLDLTGRLESVTAQNIVVMGTTLNESPFKDKYGATTPYPNTVGTGSGYVMTQGRLITATWKRETAAELPRWFDTNGDEITLRRGRTWWLIVSDLSGVSYR